MVYTDSTKWFNRFIEQKVMCDLLAGSCAGVVSVIANNPIDVIKTRLQGGESHRYKGVIHCGKAIMAEQGAWGFYSGVGPRMVRVILEVGL